VVDTHPAGSRPGLSGCLSSIGADRIGTVAECKVQFLAAVPRDMSRRASSSKTSL
jgi:hypothetical protein